MVGAACETLGMHFTSNLFIFLRNSHIPEKLDSIEIGRALEKAA